MLFRSDWARLSTEAVSTTCDVFIRSGIAKDEHVRVGEKIAVESICFFSVIQSGEWPYHSIVAPAT